MRFFNRTNQICRVRVYSNINPGPRIEQSVTGADGWRDFPIYSDTPDERFEMRVDWPINPGRLAVLLGGLAADSGVALVDDGQGGFALERDLTLGAAGSDAGGYR